MPVTISRKCGRTILAAACAAGITIGVAGCGASNASDQIGVKNQATWKMPLDDFYVYPVALDNYAEQLLISNCLETQGYEWPVPWQDTEFPLPEDFNVMNIRLFTPELAERWGYHFARLKNDESAKLWLEFVETTDSYFPNQELDDALAACSEEIRAEDEDSLINFDGMNYLGELSYQAQMIVEQDAKVIDATDAWRECLAPQVDFTLPDDPWSEMPPMSVARKWGAVTGGTPEPSAEELAVAVADAQCRESSGLSSLRYERTWEEQVKLVADNRDKLDRIRAQAEKRKAYLLTIVAENAPDAP